MATTSEVKEATVVVALVAEVVATEEVDVDTVAAVVPAMVVAMTTGVEEAAAVVVIRTVEITLEETTGVEIRHGGPNQAQVATTTHEAPTK
jgi:hypothetical protein